MIRFIQLGDQITESNNDFAFYDTVTETFCTFSGFQRWNSVEEFYQDYDGDDVERFLNLIPKNWRCYWQDVKITILGQEIDVAPIYQYTENKGKWQNIDALEKQLKDALNNEDYLRADEIQKQIKQLK